METLKHEELWKKLDKMFKMKVITIERKISRFALLLLYKMYSILFQKHEKYYSMEIVYKMNLHFQSFLEAG